MPRTCWSSRVIRSWCGRTRKISTCIARTLALPKSRPWTAKPQPGRRRKAPRTNHRATENTEKETKKDRNTFKASIEVLPKRQERQEQKEEKLKSRKPTRSAPLFFLLFFLDILGTWKIFQISFYKYLFIFVFLCVLCDPAVSSFAFAPE